MRDRREQLEITQREAADGSGGRISLPLWSVLENARQKNDTMTVMALRGADQALGWMMGSCEAILGGGEPDLEPDYELVEIDLNSAAAELTPDERRAVLDFIAEQRRKQRS